MARPPDPRLREELLSACADAAIRDGLRDITLTSLSARVGVSPRMLIYHFGSKEELLRRIVERAQAVLRAKLREALESEVPRDSRAAIRALWSHGTHPDTGPYLRAFFNLYAEAMLDPEGAAAFLDASVGGWLAWAGETLADHEPHLDPATLTLVLAVLRGLFLDYWATGDRERTTSALERFLERA